MFEKERVPDHLVFREAHKGAPPNGAGTPSGGCLELFLGLAKGQIGPPHEILAQAPPSGRISVAYRKLRASEL